MKKLLLLIAIVICFNESQGQVRLYVGGKEGVTTSQISGDAHAGFKKFGMSGGLVFRGVFNKVFGVQLEALYTEKGSKYYAPPSADTAAVSSPFYTSPTKGYFLELHYIEFPLVFQYNYPDVKGLSFEVGTSFGTLIKSFEVESEPGYNRIQYGPPFNYSEVCYNFGVSYIMTSGVGFAARFSRSITPARDFYRGEVATPLRPGQMNTVISLSITYHYGIN